MHQFLQVALSIQNDITSDRNMIGSIIYDLR